MGTLLQDVRFGARMLWKQRLITLVSIVALALGIGANTAIFSLAEAFLLRPVPVSHIDRFAALVNTQPEQNVYQTPVAPATYLEWTKQLQSFDELAAYEWEQLNLTGDPAPQKLQTFNISANFFQMLGVYPVLGRPFSPDEETSGKNHEIILSYGTWQQRYASNPNIVGTVVKADGLPYTIIGVMGKGFTFPYPAEAWTPLAMTTTERQVRNARYIWAVGHLRPGTSLAQSDAELNGIFHQQLAAYPDDYKGWQPRAIPLSEFATGNLTREYTLLLIVAVGFVLLIACVNVANVQLARMTSRTKEFAVRSALGGSRWRIVRQLLTESILLSLVGAAAGLFLASWELRVILRNMPADVAKFIAGWTTIHLDTGAFLFTLAIAVASGALSGIFPSLLSSRMAPGEALKETGRGSSAGARRHFLRNSLVVAEISMAMILLAGAGLLVKNFRGLITVNQSSRPETLLAMNMTLSTPGYRDLNRRTAFYGQALEHLATLPGVQETALTTEVPFANGGGAFRNAFAIEGRAPRERGEVLSAIVETSSPNYLRLMGISLLEGREISESDRDNGPRICLVSQSLVQRYFDGKSPLGHKIKLTSSGSENEDPWMTVAGVVADVRYSWVEKDFIPTIYRPFRQSPPPYTTLLVRTTGGDPHALAPSVVSTMAQLDPELPLYNVKSFEQAISESIVGIAYVAAMMGVLGGIALVLACVGVYGVMSYSVSERFHEIGIRMSLGAEMRDILGLVLRNGLGLTLLGLLIGLPISLLMARAMASLLFGVEASDPVAFVALPGLLAAVATVACYLPARRAARIDPLRALRHE
jgi:putative ABC transport system permease protein